MCFASLLACRQIQSLVIYNVVAKEPTFVQIKAKQPDVTVASMELPVLLPHHIVEHLLECGLDISSQLVGSFWKHLERVGDEWALLTRPFRIASESSVWPIALYGDEASMMFHNAPSHKIIGVFLSLPLFRPKCARLSRYLLFSIESSKVVDVVSSLYPAFEAIVASCNLLAEQGVQGRRFLVSEIRGDQMWIRNLFRHRAHWVSHEVCFRCKARADTTSNLRYTKYDFSNDGWHTTRRSTYQFILEELQDPLCSSVNMVETIYAQNTSNSKNTIAQNIELPRPTS